MWYIYTNQELCHFSLLNTNTFTDHDVLSTGPITLFNMWNTNGRLFSSYAASIFSSSVFVFLPATASQQESEAEPNSDPSVKASGHSPATQTLPAGAGSLSDKSNSPTYMEKSKDSAAVTVT